MSPPQSLAPFLRALDDLEASAREWQQLFPVAASQAEHWLKVLAQVRSHLAEDCLRVAVVGTVKSGKSTMINALAGQELLRRGAGILTAMITRVQPGPAARAVLRFKDWTEISQEIRRALALFPGGALNSLGSSFDLRQGEHRRLLAQDLTYGEHADLWTGSTLNQEWLLLKSYLEGYDQVGDLLEAGSLILEGDDLKRHGELVTREATAVYLRDVLLSVPIPGLPQGLELGDCQGSDSPIPQHLAQVLTYLLKSDLVLYVVSSRVGLRQGDFQFINDIKRMGLLPHTWFLLNLDLAELRGLQEIEALRERLRREVAPLAVEFPLFAFSALELLLKRRREQGENLDPREAALLPLWDADPEATAFSEAEFRRFEATFQAGLERLRRERLSGGALSQVRMVTRGLKEQIDLAWGLSGRDAAALQTLEESTAKRRRPLLATRGSLSQVLAGASDRLKKALKKRVGSFLDTHSGQGAALFEFIFEYQPDWDILIPPGSPQALRPALYRLYQEFHQALDKFVSGEMTARILEFIRIQEEWLRQELLATAAPLFLSIQEALALYYQEISAQGLPASPPRLTVELPANPPGLEVPLLTLAPEVDWRWSGEAWLRTGAGWLRRTWEAVKARLRRQAVSSPWEQTRLNLAWALKAIKERLRQEAKVSLLDFGERLKFRYFFPLVDGLAAGLEAHMEDLLKSLLADLEGLTAVIRQAGADQESRRRRLEALSLRVKEVAEKLNGLAL
ncbi:MAG: dynamin family protein [Desulfobaccales bacterium]